MKKRLNWNQLASDERVHFLFLVLLAMTVFFTRLGQNGMANFDDCFYAEKAKEILRNGHWGILSFNYQQDFGNSPLFEYLEAFAYQIFGVSVYAAKFPSALAGFLTVLLTYYLGKTLINSWVGFFAGFVLVTTYPFLKYGRHAMLDVVLAFFVTLAMVFLLWAVRKDAKYFWLWGLCVGLALLEKSALGFFPIVVTFLFLALTQQWKRLMSPHLWGGLVLALSMLGYWIFSQYCANPTGFMTGHLFGVVLSKALQKGNYWYEHFTFFGNLLTFYWPWVPFLFCGIYALLRKKLKDKAATYFLLTWSLTLFIAMSIVPYRMMWYMMQIFPAFALVTAFTLDRLLNEGKKVLAAKWFMGMGFSAVVILNVFPIHIDADRERDTRIVAPYVKYFAESGVKIIGLRDDFYGLNNSLLFFSDHAAVPVYKDVDSIKKEFTVPNKVICVAHQGDLKDIGQKIKVWFPVKYGVDLILVSNQRLDISQVPTWEGYDK